MAAAVAGPLAELRSSAGEQGKAKMRLGLCTYLWGQDWDLPTILANCEKAGVLGVELRTQHKHGVEPSWARGSGKEVKKRFADSPVTFVGLGTNECFDSPDPARLKRVDRSRQEVRPAEPRLRRQRREGQAERLPQNVPQEKTIEQIGKSLNVLGRFAADFGQQIRLEVHGSCCELPTIQQIMDVADHPNVGVCWNCNPQDLLGQGLEYNFNLVKNRLGATTHVRELNSSELSLPAADRLAGRGATMPAGSCWNVPASPKTAWRQWPRSRRSFERMLAAARKKMKGPTMKGFGRSSWCCWQSSSGSRSPGRPSGTAISATMARLPGGKTLSTAAIQKAVDHCAAAGGGTVYFPPGVWLSGTIELRSHVTLRLDGRLPTAGQFQSGRLSARGSPTSAPIPTTMSARA